MVREPAGSNLPDIQIKRGLRTSRVAPAQAGRSSRSPPIAGFLGDCLLELFGLESRRLRTLVASQTKGRWISGMAISPDFTQLRSVSTGCGVTE